MRRLTTITIGLVLIFAVSLFHAAQVEAKAEAEQAEGEAPFGEAGGTGKKFEAEFYIKYTNRGCPNNDGTTPENAKAEVALRLRDKGNADSRVFGTNVACGDVELFEVLLFNVLAALEADVCQALGMGSVCLVGVNKIDLTADDTVERVLGTVGLILKEQP